MLAYACVANSVFAVAKIFIYTCVPMYVKVCIGANAYMRAYACACAYPGWNFWKSMELAHYCISDIRAQAWR